MCAVRPVSEFVAEDAVETIVYQSITAIDGRHLKLMHKTKADRKCCSLIPSAPESEVITICRSGPVTGNRLPLPAVNSCS